MIAFPMLTLRVMGQQSNRQAKIRI